MWDSKRADASCGGNRNLRIWTSKMLLVRCYACDKVVMSHASVYSSILISKPEYKVTSIDGIMIKNGKTVSP